MDQLAPALNLAMLNQVLKSLVVPRAYLPVHELQQFDPRPDLHHESHKHLRKIEHLPHPLNLQL